MKFLLAAINAKYIHSNLGVYSIKKYADEKLRERPDGIGQTDYSIEIGEYTINHQMEMILQDIYRRSPDVVGFSCYIWNILYVLEIIRDLKKVLPDVKIWLGGPEVSYDAVRILERETAVDGIMIGEGEETFCRLAKGYLRSLVYGNKPEKTAEKTAEENQSDFLYKIPGLAFRAEDGSAVLTPPAPLMDLNEISFSYGDLSGLEHRIIYYESSRGCPFSCSYCLSSIDKTVRFRNMELVKRELAFFLEHKVPQVKFVDRTFNCRKDHALAIWRFLAENDNGITNFHFEISSDLLDEEELAVLKEMRPGLIQLEIGVQTTNPQTIGEIRRRMDLEKVKNAVARVNSFRNIHQHLDLIAGLPFEDYESFGRSFDEVYAMEPEQLQLGFLKVLKGSYMEEKTADYGLSYRSCPPYEVLSTRWLSFEDVIRLKGVEEMVEVHYNSGQFRNTVRAMQREFPSPFAMYEALAQYYRREHLDAVNHSRLARYEILFAFIKERLALGGSSERSGGNAGEGIDGRGIEGKGVDGKGITEILETYRDLLMYDLYLRENVKSRPSFARDQGPYKHVIKQFFISEGEAPVYLTGYEGYDSRQMSKMAHIEVMGDGTLILFDYKHRDALLGNARAVRLPEGVTGK